MNPGLDQDRGWPRGKALLPYAPVQVGGSPTPPAVRRRRRPSIRWAAVLLGLLATACMDLPEGGGGRGKAILEEVPSAGGPATFRLLEVDGSRPAGELAGDPGYRATVFYWPGDSLRALRVAGIIEGVPDLPGLPPGIPSGAHIVLVPSEALFDSLTGGLVPEWGAGVAVPSLGRIVLPIYPAERTRGWDEPRVVRHEWAHIALHQALPGLRIPRWFNEGYAEWASGAWTAEEGWRLRVAMAMGRLPPLDSLALEWPRDRASAELSYVLAASAVEFLVDRSGERGIRVLLERWAEEQSFEAAIRGTYGLTGSQLEEDWRGFVRSRYGWLTVLARSAVFWLLAGVVLTGLFVIRKRRDRVRMEKLRAEEPPDTPAWWVEGEGEPSGGDRRTTVQEDPPPFPPPGGRVDPTREWN